MSKPILSAQIYKASTTELPQPSLDGDWRKYQRQVRRKYDELDLPPPSNLFATGWRKVSSIFTRSLIRFRTFAAKRTLRRRRRHDCPYSPKGSLTLTFLLATTWSGVHLREDLKAGNPWGIVPTKGDAVMLIVAMALYPSSSLPSTLFRLSFFGRQRCGKHASLTLGT